MYIQGSCQANDNPALQVSEHLLPHPPIFCLRLSEEHVGLSCKVGSATEVLSGTRGGQRDERRAVTSPI
jgi:hypothetical protein